VDAGAHANPFFKSFAMPTFIVLDQSLVDERCANAPSASSYWEEVVSLVGKIRAKNADEAVAYLSFGDTVTLHFTWTTDTESAMSSNNE
jgi:hypothetical protein